MILQQGRPTDCAGRPEKEIRCYDLLDSLDIDYQRIDHEPAMTMEICAALDDALGALICKNLLLCNRQCTDFYMLMMPANKPFKTKDLSKQIGCSRLSFAGAEHMETLLGVTPGSVTVLGLMNDKEKKVGLLVDEDVLACDWVGCHPCINTSSIRLRTADVLISKGQGNFESLSERAENIYFLLMTKCPTIAKRAGTPEKALICRKNPLYQEEHR